MKVSTDKEKIARLLTHQVEDVYVRENLEKKLLEGKSLNIKLGADPSRPDLHLGHAVVLRKLRAFQELGHKVIFIIGDFTGLVGDPTGKSKTRPQLTEKEIKGNAKTYLRQVGKILDTKKCDVVFNSKWLGKLKATDFIHLASLFTVARILERDDFTKRMASGTEIHVHEMLYPMLQAQDSIHLDADVELGGTDQTFNMLAGRELAKKLGVKQQNVMTFPLLVGTDGVKKMSKSLDNYIALEDAPDDMFGKAMSVPDSALEQWIRLAADYSDEEVETELSALKSGENPRNVKARLAKRIVAEWHSSDDAEKAEEVFNARFKEGKLPENMEEHSMDLGIKLYEVVATAFKISNSQARRDIEAGGVKVDGEAVKDPHHEISEGEYVVQKGKRHAAKITLA